MFRGDATGFHVGVHCLFVVFLDLESDVEVFGWKLLLHVSDRSLMFWVDESLIFHRVHLWASWLGLTCLIGPSIVPNGSNFKHFQTIFFTCLS